MVECLLTTQRFAGPLPWAIRSHACASVTKQYNLIPACGRWCSSAGKVITGLVESNGSLPPGGWLKHTCRLTACTPGSAPDPTLSNEYGTNCLYFVQVTFARLSSGIAEWLFTQLCHDWQLWEHFTLVVHTDNGVLLLFTYCHRCSL